MEEEKNFFIDKGLSLRSEEVNEVMGTVPHRIFRVGTFIIICIIILLAAVGYILQVPSYIEVPYIVFGNTPAIGIISKNAGIIMFRYNQPHDIEVGDTIASITKDNKSFYYISPTNGIIESNFLYVTGDNISSGDTLARIISHESPNYKLILKIPLNIKSEIKSGLRVKFTVEGATTENVVGYIKKISVIPDESNCYNAIVEMPISIMQNLPTSGKAKIHYRTENIFKKILATKKVSRSL